MANPLDLFERPSEVPAAPHLPQASPVGNPAVLNPVRSGPSRGTLNPSEFSTPYLQTPALTAHESLAYPGAGGSIDLSALGGDPTFGSGLGSSLPSGKTPFSDVLGWGWELGSDVGSVPSVWSRASTSRSVQGLSGDGQRLIYIKPQEVAASTGGTVVIGLRKEIPEQLWSHVEILLVGGQEGQLKLQPCGIRRGKKLAIKVPPNLDPRDYDVRVVFGGKILHGAIPLAVRGEESDDNSEEGEGEM